MLDSILKACETAWIKTKTKKNHPFRFFTLATTDPQGQAEARMVVLRKFDAKHFEFTIYTDLRTPKIASIEHNPAVELLFYDHKKLWQIRVKAKCIAKRKDPVIFKQQQEAAQKDYTTIVAPGTKLKAMDAVEYGNENYFAVLTFRAFHIDHLQLKRPNHQRAIFNLQDQKWEGTFVTP